MEEKLREMEEAPACMEQLEKRKRINTKLMEETTKEFPRHGQGLSDGGKHRWETSCIFPEDVSMSRAAIGSPTVSNMGAGPGPVHHHPRGHNNVCATPAICVLP